MCPEYGGICNSGASSILLVGVVMCSQDVGCEEATFCIFRTLYCRMMLRKAIEMSNSANIDLLLLKDCVSFPVDLKTGHYQVNLVQFRFCWDWGTCPLYGIWRFLHFRGFDCIHKQMKMHLRSNYVSAIS